jgi:hypothetical protein
MGAYETGSLTPAQARLFCRIFDEKIGTDRETNGLGFGDNDVYVICFELEDDEPDQCADIEAHVTATLK